ncbi:lactadherin-like [Patiria miniata]|uniref:F5/8 type C domain-containing protein n=1 Tax=Patiria miniata TaxID=46514 RepID=A0A914A8D5_PATMI|nr:lactadherin-like [Patiria miniata]
MIKMKCLLIALFAVVVQCCLFAATAHADSDCDSCLEAALRPLYSQLDVFRDQLDAVHVSCTKDVLDCSEVGPLGMEDGRIPDASITASSFFYNLANYAPHRARLNFQGGISSAWASAGPSDPNPWIQVDFGTSVIVTGVITQGRGDSPYDNQLVSEFKVAYSNDGQEWTYVTAEGATSPRKFPGNLKGHNSQVTTTFPKAFQAKFLRILPTKWGAHCSMRFEVLGCESHE